jgi:hypothetical protein
MCNVVMSTYPVLFGLIVQIGNPIGRQSTRYQCSGYLYLIIKYVRFPSSTTFLINLPFHQIMYYYQCHRLVIPREQFPSFLRRPKRSIPRLTQTYQFRSLNARVYIDEINRHNRMYISTRSIGTIVSCYLA